MSSRLLSTVYIRPGKRRRPSWVSQYVTIFAVYLCGFYVALCTSKNPVGIGALSSVIQDRHRARSRSEHEQHVGPAAAFVPPALHQSKLGRTARYAWFRTGCPCSRYQSRKRSRLIPGAADPATASNGDGDDPASSGQENRRRGGIGGGVGGFVNDDPTVHSLVDLVELLHESENPLWELIRFEGREASRQSHVSSMIHGSVMARTSLEDAVTCDVANKMSTTFLSATEVSSLMCEMFADDPSLDFVVAEDLFAHAMQDTSLPDVLTAMLFHKGFTALTTYRLMHWLWQRDRRNLARYLQSICSEVCAADIHPASNMGKGILMASGCDIVIGETAVVGDGVCLLHGVTLGGTGNQTGDRHPKVGKGCHIGAGSSVLGNIPIGEGSRIEAASVVVKPVPPYTVNRGVPSKTVAYVVCDPHQDIGAGSALGSNKAAKDAHSDDSDVEDVEPRHIFTCYGSLYIGV